MRGYRGFVGAAVLLCLLGCESGRSGPKKATTAIEGYLSQLESKDPRQQRRGALSLSIHLTPKMVHLLPRLLRAGKVLEGEAAGHLFRALAKLGPKGWWAVVTHRESWAKEPRFHWFQALKGVPTKALYGKLLERWFKSSGKAFHWADLGQLWRAGQDQARARWLIGRLSHPKAPIRAAASLALARPRTSFVTYTQLTYLKAALPLLLAQLKRPKEPLCVAVASAYTLARNSRFMWRLPWEKYVQKHRRRMLAVLERGLLAKDPKLRALSAEAHAWVPSPWPGYAYYQVRGIGEALMRASVDPVWQVRYWAVLGLQQLRWPDAAYQRRRDAQKARLAAWKKAAKKLSPKARASHWSTRLAQQLDANDSGPVRPGFSKQLIFSLSQSLHHSRVELRRVTPGAFIRFATLWKLPISLVLPLHKDEDPIVQSRLLGAIVKRIAQDPKGEHLTSQKVLLQALSHPSFSTRKAALDGLLRLKQRGAFGLPALKKAWAAEKDPGFRKGILAAIQGMGPKAAGALSWLLGLPRAAMTHDTRLAHTRVFGAMGARAAKAALPLWKRALELEAETLSLGKAPRSKAYEQRVEEWRAVAAALARIGVAPKRAIDQLRKLLLRERGLHAMAIECLGLWGTRARAAVGEVLHRLSTFDAKKARGFWRSQELLELLNTLGAISGDSPSKAKVFRALQGYLKHPSPQVVYAASKAMARLGLPSSSAFAALVGKLPLKQGADLRFTWMLAEGCQRHLATCARLLTDAALALPARQALVKELHMSYDRIPALWPMLHELALGDHKLPSSLQLMLHRAAQKIRSSRWRKPLDLLQKTLGQKGPKQALGRWYAAVASLHWEHRVLAASVELLRSLNADASTWRSASRVGILLSVLRPLVRKVLRRECCGANQAPLLAHSDSGRRRLAHSGLREIFQGLIGYYRYREALLKRPSVRPASPPGPSSRPIPKPSSRPTPKPSSQRALPGTRAAPQPSSRPRPRHRAPGGSSPR